ncbi:hypothetical protein SAMN05216167_12152 [Spirosoma endophyticum]|uniref:Uncharacterized protein n=1 Tax=Spirosoma endophyticum TaxID=662367 RepID=A0A1I2E8L1_9BACT|nr:hypothetical protein SAMN05216167_12152 [Spirosoma endophyticum]
MGSTGVGTLAFKLLKGFWCHWRKKVHQIAIWISEQQGTITPWHGSRLLNDQVT